MLHEKQLETLFHKQNYHWPLQNAKSSYIRSWFGWLCTVVQGLRQAGEPPSQQTNLPDALEQEKIRPFL